MKVSGEWQTIADVPGSDRRDERITIRITKQLRDKIERAADRDRRKVSDWIVVKLEDILKQGK